MRDGTRQQPPPLFTCPVAPPAALVSLSRGPRGMFASTKRFGAAVGVINRVEVKPLSKILARLLASLPNKVCARKGIRHNHRERERESCARASHTRHERERNRC